MREEVLEQFSRFRRRHLWVRGWDLFLEAAFVMTVAAGGMLLLDRLAFELGLSSPHLAAPERIAVVLGGTLLLAAGTAAALLLLRPTPPVEIAWRLDRASGGEERFLSALEISVEGGGGLFASALCRDATDRVRGVAPSRVLPRVPVGYRWGILLSLVSGGLLWAWPPQVYDAPRPDFEISAPRGPAPLEVAFRDASIGAIDSFHWEFGDGRTAPGEAVTHVYEVPGRYAVALTVTGPGGAARKTGVVEVLSPDQAQALFDAEPRKGRIPLTVRFTNRSKNARRQTWTFGDGTTSTESEPSHTYDKPGSYTVRLRVENDLGADEQIRPDLIKAVHPDEPLANFRAIPREGEAPLEVGFEDLSSGELAEWKWDFGDPRAPVSGFSRERNPSHTYTVPGRYTVRLAVRGPHGEDEEEKVHYVHVKGDGGGKGGGSQAKAPKAPKSAASAGGREGRLFGEKPERPPVTLIPEVVKSHKPGEERVEKDVRIFGPGPEGKGKAGEVPLHQILPRYQRAAEDSIERERIPPALREHVRRYYESLRPK